MAAFPASIALAALVAAPALAVARTHDPALPSVPLPGAYEGSAAAAAPQALDRWWTRFGDPVLDALEAEALAASPDIQTLQARLVEARASRAAQIAGTLPTGSVTANASHQVDDALGVNDLSNINNTTGVTNSVAANFDVSWEIDLFGRLAARRRVARAAAWQAVFDVQASRAALAADVADAWFQMRGSAVQLDDALASVAIETRLLDIARRRAAAGAGPEDEVDRVLALAEQSQARADDLRAQLADARRTLLILVGRDLRGLSGLATPAGDPPPAPPPPAALPSDLLQRRPDVREAEFHLRAQLGTAQLAHKAIFPTFTLLPGLGLSSTSSPGVSYIPPTTLIEQQQVATTGLWSLGIGVTAPILDIPRLLDEAHAEDARSRQAAIAYEKAVRSAFGEAQNALVDLTAGEQAADRLSDSEVHARRAYEASKRRYGEGLDDLTATLTAEQSWRAIRLALTSERVEALRRAVRAYKALGGGWPAGSAG